MFICCPSIQKAKKCDNSSPPVPKEKVFKCSDVPNLCVTPPKAWVELSQGFVTRVWSSCFHIRSLRPHSIGEIALPYFLSFCRWDLTSFLLRSALLPCLLWHRPWWKAFPATGTQRYKHLHWCHQVSEQLKCSLPEKSFCRQLPTADLVSDSSSWRTMLPFSYWQVLGAHRTCWPSA